MKKEKEENCKVCGHKKEHHWKHGDCGEENSCKECDELSAMYDTLERK